MCFVFSPNERRTDAWWRVRQTLSLFHTFQHIIGTAESLKHCITADNAAHGLLKRTQRIHIRQQNGSVPHPVRTHYMVL